MKLFEPGKIGRLEIKNRIMFGAAAIGGLIEPVGAGGRMTQRGIDYHVARAKGGTGLIIATPANNRYMSNLRELAEAVHDHGAKICVQLGFGIAGTRGLNTNPDWNINTGLRGEFVAPSSFPNLWDPKIIARALTTKEVEQIIAGYEPAAELVRLAGIDAIEIHSHGGYLLDEFMTAKWNKRTDKYGGDLDGRLRCSLEIIQAIKRGAGDDFPLFYDYGPTHYMEGAREIEEGLEIARRFEAAGIDALHIDAGCYANMYWLLPPTTQPHGCMVDLAEKVKKAVNIPVIATGKLDIPDLAERVLQEGKADFIAICKGLIADPEWPNKVKEGRLEDIRPCIGDHECLQRVAMGPEITYISCSVNPACGMEREFTIKPADKKKSVLVVGGGPGGMEAAMVAAQRGHKVTLYEKDYALGGNLIPASVPAFKEDYQHLLSYLITQIRKLGVEIKLATEVTPELVQAMKSDVVFVATGSTPIIPDIPGIEKVVTAVDVLMGRKEAGETVVVLGGGMVGSETALYLAQKGKKVTIAAASDSIMRDVFVGSNRQHLLKLIEDANIKVLTGANPVKITDNGVIIADKSGKRSTLKADTVILAKGYESRRGLAEALRDKAPEVYTIGDCVEPRLVKNAIWEGFRTARLI